AALALARPALAPVAVALLRPCAPFRRHGMISRASPSPYRAHLLAPRAPVSAAAALHRECAHGRGAGPPGRDDPPNCAPGSVRHLAVLWVPSPATRLAATRRPLATEGGMASAARPAAGHDVCALMAGGAAPLG